MNWEAVGAVGEIVGALGVIVTLVYLAMQIQQNTKASRAATVQNMTDKWVQINLFLSEHSPRVGSLVDSELDPIQRQRAIAFYRALFHQWSNNHYQYRQGVLDEELFKPTEQEITRMAGSPDIGPNLRLAWNVTRHIYNDDFGSLMDKILRENRSDA